MSESASNNSKAYADQVERRRLAELERIKAEKAKRDEEAKAAQSKLEYDMIDYDKLIKQ